MANHTTEAELRALTAQGMSFKQISAKLGMPLGTISIAASALGIRSGYKPIGHVSTLNLAAALEGMSNGLSLRELAALQGTASQSLFRALKSKGLPTCSAAYLRWKAAERKAA